VECVQQGLRGEEPGDAVVRVLIDDDEPEVPVGLRLERLEQCGEVVRAVDRRHDEVEAGGS
jgi:hypothetical protein